MTRERASLWIAACGFLVIAGLGFALYLRDGSYFRDEASVVLSFEELSVFEAFTARLSGGGQSFPRIYLLVIRGIRWLFGPETWATRLLPHLCFLGATALWMRLFLLRFQGRPMLILLGATLVMMSASWWSYSAVVKQYTLDVLLCLALFSLPDSLLDDVLRRRRRLGWLVGIVLPVALSYTYGVVLLGRTIGWLAFGWVRGRRANPRALAWLVGGMIAAAGLLWLTDVRHTLGREALVTLWQNCVASRQSPGDLPELLRRFLASWYVGPSEFLEHPKLLAPVLWLLIGAQALGLVRVVRSMVVRDNPELEQRWGSRSAGCVVALVGAIAISFVLEYPICAGRLTLYVLCFQQILMLEGLDWAISGVSRETLATGPRTALKLVAGFVLAGIIAASAVSAVEVGRRLLERLPAGDVRPLLQRVRDEPELPVLVTACIANQLRTLPEGLDGLNVRWLPVSGWKRFLPRGREVWIIHSEDRGLCELIRRRLRKVTYGLDTQKAEWGSAALYRGLVLTKQAQSERRKDTYRKLNEAERGGSESLLPLNRE